MAQRTATEGWGIDKVPYPQGNALICTRDLLCVGCGICELACAVYHFGEFNKELSRVRIQKRMTPISKSLQTVCSQCNEEERSCQKACLLDPPAIHFDAKNLHMTVDVDRCLGAKCGKCAQACEGNAIHFYPPEHDYAIVCDLCEKEGKRQPRCVDVCPRQALEYISTRQHPFIKESQHLWKLGYDRKAEAIHKRTYPLAWDNLGPTDKTFDKRRENQH